ncbi:MFS transporter [Streptomyces avicenniae]|uniref:MFS transporter n=1 Tax=Streptomyces avicenniae TaxID=500153 RepID=UPI000699C431|nr:MFS transporter [Streptomyces avicenniae]
MSTERPAVTRRHPAPAAAVPGGPPAPGGRWRFRGAAYTLLVLLVGTNVPTPLYRGYQESFGFSALVVTLVFAVYAAVLIPSLLSAGPLTDLLGRRALLLGAVTLAALGSLAFALATGPGWLFAARALQGIALGAASGPLTAALTELEPAGDHRRAAFVSTVISVGGLGLGPLLGGLLAEYAPAPGVLPFAVEIALLVPAAVAVAALPTAARGARRRPRRPGVPAGMRPVLVSSGAASFLAFAVTGLFLTLVPTYVTTLADSRNLLLAGASVGLLLLCSALAQLAGHGRSARRLELTGLPLLATGLVLLALAGGLSSLALLLTATAVGGVGQGLTFLGGLTAVNQAAPPDRRAEALSTFYVILYLGVSVPVVGVGFLATVVGLLTAVQCFAAVTAALCVAVLLVLARGHRRA